MEMEYWNSRNFKNIGTANNEINRGTKILKNIRIIKYSRIFERIKFLRGKILKNISILRISSPFLMDPLYKKNPSTPIHFDNNDFVINYEPRHPLINLPKSRKINPVTTVTVDSGKRWKLEYWTQQVQPGHNFGIWAPFEGEPRRQGPMNHTLVNLYPYPPLCLSHSLSLLSAAPPSNTVQSPLDECISLFLFPRLRPSSFARVVFSYASRLLPFLRECLPSSRAVQGSRPSKCTLLFWLINR